MIIGKIYKKNYVMKIFPKINNAKLIQLFFGFRKVEEAHLHRTCSISLNESYNLLSHYFHDLVEINL
jgi:hypothetical protein